MSLAARFPTCRSMLSEVSIKPYSKVSIWIEWRPRPESPAARMGRPDPGSGHRDGSRAAQTGTDSPGRRDSMRQVELRSDTLTRPTPSMRKAMAEAEVGDDVFGEDPTVNRLEELAAERLAKEAALFVPSGTMANLVSQMAHCGRGDEMILGNLAHSFYYEQGGSAAVASIHPRIVPNRPDGKIPLDELEAAIRGDNIHFP